MDWSSWVTILGAVFSAGIVAAIYTIAERKDRDSDDYDL